MNRMNLKDFICSEKNIFMAIYAVKSYVFDVQLLSDNDKELLNKLADSFNEKTIKRTIKNVKIKIEEVLSNDLDLFEVQVYFKPKDIVDNVPKFRPMHSSDLITLIAMVSLLHALIYEIPSKNQNYKLYLSNYSKLIPKNFYGNRVSSKPEALFLNWAEQYKLYTQKANEYFSRFHETKEYKYELKLDLKNFFPSVDPGIIYYLLIENIPVSFVSEEDVLILKRIIYKLLVCRVTNLHNDTAKRLYYVASEPKNDFQNVQEYFDGFTKGLAQGLPQSYFFGNICMIKIAEIFDEVFQGKSVYYVDDSYIYTNEKMDGNSFDEKLKIINDKIHQEENSIINKVREDDYFKTICKWQRNDYYGIEVHTKGKSSFCDISNVNRGEYRIKKLSREASEVGADMLYTYSEDEDKALLGRVKTILAAIEKELEKIDRETATKDNDSKNNSYIEKLERYKKFFKYRALKLELRVENKLTKKIFEVLVGGELNEKKSYFDQLQGRILIDKFFKNYKHDVWQVAVSILMNNVGEQEEKIKLKSYLQSIIKEVYSKELLKCSYLAQSYKGFIDGKESTVNESIYYSLNIAIKSKMRRYIQVNNVALKNEFNKAKMKGISEDYVINSYGICTKNYIETCLLVLKNSDRLQRIFLNALYSAVFKVDLSDDMRLCSRDKKGMTYGILRILLYLRNSRFSLAEFFRWDIDIFSNENMQQIDYDILEILDIYKRYVVSPYYIDNLIITHKYTCEIWKNGAKHLYFYTLHNQEHAIDLIKNVVKIIKVVSYLKISSYDYYLVFLSCYLHDIAMVRIASESDFLTDKNKSEEIVTRGYEELQNDKAKNRTKKIFSDIYKLIDEFYETLIRSNHASNSAEEIRNLQELSYLDDSVREFVADISKSHAMDVREIYFAKGEAKNRKISMKFDKIILRLADLLDMSEYRVSKPILNHNIDNMSDVSAFHWVSHLLTAGYELSANYIKNQNENEFLDFNSIIEKINLTIYVKLSQMSKLAKGNCKYCKLLDEELSADGLTLEISNQNCSSKKCNYLCRWFNIKNEYLMKELHALENYLSRIPSEDKLYNTKFKVYIKVISSTTISQEQFEKLNKVIKNNSH